MTLDTIYLVERVLVFGREDIDPDQFDLLDVSVGRSKSSLKGEQFTSTNATIKELILNHPREIKYVRVTGGVIYGFMTICEIMIYRQADCPLGSYSVNCSKQCHCLVGPCDIVTGACENEVCADGWKGQTCNEKCGQDKFGINCSSQCHCLPGARCDHVSGNCSDDLCEPGLTGRNCSVACGQDMFGINCSSPCHILPGASCDQVSCNCSDDLSCEQGLFGVNCSSRCHCLPGSNCDHVSGNCSYDLCAPGWTGLNSSVECDQGHLGVNCSSACHCYNGSHAIKDYLVSIVPHHAIAFSEQAASMSSASVPMMYVLLCGLKVTAALSAKLASTDTAALSMDCHCDTCHHVNGSCVGSLQCHDGFRMKNEMLEELFLTENRLLARTTT
ncbi:hypothetical protein DPMN_106551 [Dreissena polymorpha]|uniref:Uncharacterized protein n=1 Tax=Dreissena polymorpha TaxID=45954 RepID=A0A9D4K5D1_DREPO|nr:hypothetical protein DPMN_106551 [Dreissena polymorpha]